MAGFCGSCGTALKPGNRFCPGCGGPILLAAGAPIEADPPTPLSGISLKTKIIAIGVLAVALIGLLLFSQRSDTKPEVAAAAEATAPASDAPRPQAWFDNYADKFVSAEIERITAGPAQKRNFPTALGSKVVGKVAAGEAISGRLVEGADPKTRWLKTADGGYVWDGNLAPADAITSLMVNRFPVDAPFRRIEADFRSDGRYGSQDVSWDVNACEIYTSRDGLVDAMVIEGQVVRYETESPKLSTVSGVRVGSSEAQLLRAYGRGKLKREENPYAGVDYFNWVTKDRGIKFNVYEGKVTRITAGAAAIRYVEGCL